MKKIRLRERDGCWHYDFRVQGKRLRNSTGLKATPANRAEAERIAEAERNKAIRQAVARSGLPAEAMKAVKLFDRYYAEKERLGRAPGTLVHYTQNKRLFVDHFGENILLSALTSQKIQDWAFWISKQEVQVALWLKPKYRLSLLQRRNHWYYNFEIKGKRTRLSTRLRATEENRDKALSIGKAQLRKALRSLPEPEGMEKRTYSPKSVKEAINWLSSVFRYFELKNPCIKVERPKQSEIEREDSLKYYSPEQLKKLLKKCRAKKDPDANPRDWRGWYSFYSWLVLISHTGIRSGEAQGIRGIDIDWENSVLRVTSRKTKTRRSLNLSPGEFKEGTKSQNGNPWLHLTLLHRAAQEHYEEQGKTMSDNDPLYWQNQTWLYKKMQTLCQACEIPFLGIHALRHSFATIALRTWNISILSKFLGHKDISTTFGTYGHLMPQDRFLFSLDD